MKNTPLSRKANLVLQEMEDEILIYDLNTNKAFCLNETSAVIWQLCDGQRTVTEIAEIISKKFNTPANEDLVWLTLDLLKKENLLENEVELTSRFAGMSRRQVIKKVGLGTMIALPIVASLVAPVVAEAASCIGPLNRAITVACTQSCQCYNNLINGPNNMCCRATTTMIGIITFPANQCSSGLQGGCLSF